MIGDGIENCIRYAKNFNPEKSKNPFAYFTQIIYYAFIRRITKEKKQTAIRQKLIDNTALKTHEVMEGDEDVYHNTHIEFLRDHLNDQQEILPKKRKKSKRGIEHFIEELNENEI
jgi:DNA-directed RNA polymerase specialized sigma24 family protein